MKKVFLFISASFFVLCTSVYGGVPFAGCPLVNSTPKIDGKIDEPVWGEAFVCNKFRSLDGKQKGEPGTCFLMYSDGKKLYIAVIADDPKPSELPTTKSPRDKIEWKETIEIFISPQVESGFYYQFVFTPGGGFLDNVASAVATDYNFDIDYAVAVNKSGWVVEMAIPLDQIGIKGLVDRDEFSLNIGRTTGSHRFSERHQVWSPTKGGFHDRDSFGRVVVGDISKSVQKISDQIQEMNTQLSALKPESMAPREKTKVQGKIKRLLDEAKLVKTIPAYGAFFAKAEALKTQISSVLLPQDSLLLCRENPWRLPQEGELKDVSEKIDSIDLQAMRGENLDVAISVVNPTSKRMRVRCVPSQFLNMENSEEVASEKALRIYKVATLAIKGGVIQRDALVKIGMEHSIELLPCQNEIIWLRINTDDLVGGVWRSQISFQPLVNREFRKDIFLTVRVIPYQFAFEGVPYSNNWGEYHAMASGGKNRHAAFIDQKEHDTNVHLIKRKSLGFYTLKFDKDGKPVGEPDFSGLNEYIDNFGSKKQLYLLRILYSYLPKEMGGYNNFSPQAKANFKWYLDKLMANIKARGLTYQNIAWYPVCEPDVARAKEAIKFDKLLLEADPRQQIFCTVYSATPLAAIELLCPYVNIWCPTYEVKPEQLNAMRTKSTRPVRMFSYQVLPRASNPWIYRVMCFRCLKAGYEGIGFWSYDDAGRGHRRSTWDDFDTDKASDYAVVYEGGDGPLPSVRWQAWGQTLQSYRYVKWLRQLADNAKDLKLAAEAKKMTDQAVTETLGSKDYTVADIYTDKMRVMVAKLLTAEGKITPSDFKKILAPQDYCLTGNGLMLPNYHTGGSYEYNIYPNGQMAERCGVKSGEIFFDGKDAKTGPQAANKLNGTLTDIKRYYPDTWVCWNNSSGKLCSITFDLKKEYLLTGASVDIDFFPMGKLYKTISVYTSNDKKSWDLVEKIDMVPITTVRQTEDGQLIIDLMHRQARYVKFEIETISGSTNIGEIRIYGSI